MKLAADMGLHSGRAAPSLHESPYRQFKKATGRRSTYPLPIPVQTNRASSKAFVPTFACMMTKTIVPLLQKLGHGCRLCLFLWAMVMLKVAIPLGLWCLQICLNQKQSLS